LLGKNRLDPPPLVRREQILSQYYENITKMDRIDALVIYRNTMGKLYRYYNPSLYVRYWKREDFFPKDDYYED